MTKLKVQIGRTQRRRLAGDMAVRNDLMLNSNIVTDVIRYTNPASPLVFFSNVLGTSGQGSDDGMFSLETRGISSQFVRILEYKTGMKRPIRVLDNSKVPDPILANVSYDIMVDEPIDEDENLLAKDQETLFNVRSVRVGESVTLTVQMIGFAGETKPRSLLGVQAPLNYGYGNTKGEGSLNGNSLLTSESQSNVFSNPLVTMRYYFTVTGDYLANEIYTLKCTNPVDNREEDFAIDLPIEFMRETMASLEGQMLHSRGNFDIETLKIHTKSRGTRYSERPLYIGLYQQLDDIQEVKLHSISSDTLKQARAKIEGAVRYISEMTGTDMPVIAAVCQGAGAEFIREVFMDAVASQPVQYQEVVTDSEGYLNVGFRVKQYRAQHGTVIIYDIGKAMTSRRNGREFDQITYNGVSSDVRSTNIYFVPLTRPSKNGGRVKTAHYYYKEGQVKGFGKTSRALVFGKTKGITGEGNNISGEELMRIQEETIRTMMNRDANRIDSTVDGNQYQVLTQGSPYVNVDGSVRLILLR